MGGAIPLALGLAMARPRRQVLVVSGDGALLMNLGSLVTVAGSGAANLTVVVLENELYEVTGGQKTAAAGAAVDFASLARAAGFASALSFDDLAEWQSRAAKLLSLPGPRFVSLKVDRTPSEFLQFKTPPVGEQLAALVAAVNDTCAREASS